MSHDLSINLLGPFSVIYKGELLTFATDKARAVLAYLFLSDSACVPRLRLSAFLWPDLPEHNALKNLRQTIYVLRNGLKPLLDDHPDALSAERTAVGLALDGVDVRVDVRRFDALAAHCQTHEHAAVETCSVCQPYLERAAELYTGELLAGLDLGDVSNDFEHWLQVEQNSRRQAALWISAALTQHAYAIGNYALAQRHAKRALQLEPWHEPVNRLLMQIYAAAGNSAGMRAQYIFLQRQLARALNARPDQTTQKLYERLRADSPPRPIVRAPEQPTPFFGRAAELDRLCTLLVDPTYRLITVLGEGGIGKSRLAAAAARRVAHSFADGATFVSLATVVPDETTPLDELLAAAVCAALDWLPSPQQALLPQLLHRLRGRSALLALDNLEQLPGVDAFIGSLLGAAPGLTVLATSRAAVGAAREYLFALGGLAGNEEPGDLTPDGVALLTERMARSGGPPTLASADRAHAPELCRFVGGNPLGIELAAPLARQLGVAGALAAIRADYRRLADGAPGLPERHRSMEAVLHSSWSALAPPAQKLLARLSVFEGSFSAAAVAAVATCATVDADELAHLTARGLVQRVGEHRYAMHELLRRFTADKLAATDDPTAWRDRHAAHFLDRLHDLEASLWSSGAGYRELLVDWDDVRAAWIWAAQRDQFALLRRGIGALALLSRQTGRTAECDGLLTTAVEALQTNQAQQPHDQRLATLVALQDQRIALALIRHDLQWVETMLPEAQAQAQALGDPELQMLLHTREASLAMATADTARLLRATELARQLAAGIPVQPVHLLLYEQLGIAASSRGNWPLAEQYLQEAVETALAHKWLWGAGVSMLILATLYRQRGTLDRALTQHDHVAEMMQAFPQQPDRGVELFHRGVSVYLLGRKDEARACWTQAIPALREIGRANYVVRATIGLALAAAAQSDRAGAQRAAEQALRLARELADPILITLSSVMNGRELVEQERLTDAAPLFDEALRLAEQIDQPALSAIIRAEVILLALRRNDLATAVTLAEAVLPTLPRLEYSYTYDPVRSYLLCHRALATAGDPRASEVLTAAHAFLDQHARRIENPAVQQEFLNGFASHQELQQMSGPVGTV